MLRLRVSSGRACLHRERFKRATRAPASLQADSALQSLHKWYIEQNALQPPGVEAVLRQSEHFGEQPACVATRDTAPGEVRHADGMQLLESCGCLGGARL